MLTYHATKHDGQPSLRLTGVVDHLYRHPGPERDPCADLAEAWRSKSWICPASRSWTPRGCSFCSGSSGRLAGRGTVLALTRHSPAVVEVLDLLKLTAASSAIPSCSRPLPPEGAVMDMDKAKQTFIIEARELLAAMEEALLAMEGEADQGEAINAMFRAVHTIKGSAGLFGLDAIVHFSHTVESVMDRVRGRQIALGPALIGLLLECHDHLANLISACQEGGPETPGSRDLSQKPHERSGPLPGRAGAAAPAAAPVADPRAKEQRRRLATSAGISPSASAPDVLRNGMDPLSFIRYLGTLGRIVHLASLLETMPAGEAYRPRDAATSAWSWTWTPTQTARPSRMSSSSCGRTAASGCCLPMPRSRSTSAHPRDARGASASLGRSWWPGAASPPRSWSRPSGLQQAESLEDGASPGPADRHHPHRGAGRAFARGGGGPGQAEEVPGAPGPGDEGREGPGGQAGPAGGSGRRAGDRRGRREHAGRAIPQ